METTRRQRILQSVDSIYNREIKKTASAEKTVSFLKNDDVDINNYFDYKKNTSDIQLSLICPTIKSNNFIATMTNSIITKLNIEIIFVGVIDKPDIPDNFKWIKVSNNIKPVQCSQIGMYHAIGETVSICADDQTFSKYAWDEAYSIYKKSNNYKTIVGLNWFELESENDNTIDNFKSYLPLCKFGDIQLPTGDSIISKKFFMELKGFDRNYIRQQYERDFFLRAILAGANIQFAEHGSVFEYQSNHPVSKYMGTNIESVPIDFEREKDKWKIEDNKLIQCLKTDFFEFNNTIYTINQGQTFGKWKNKIGS